MNNNNIANIYDEVSKTKFNKVINNHEIIKYYKAFSKESGEGFFVSYNTPKVVKPQVGDMTIDTITQIATQVINIQMQTFKKEMFDMFEKIRHENEQKFNFIITTINVNSAKQSEEIAELKESVKELSMRVSNLETRMDALESKVDNLSNRVSKLETRMDALESKVDDLSNRMIKLEEKVDDLSLRVSKLEDNVKDLSLRVTELENNDKS